MENIFSRGQKFFNLNRHLNVKSGSMVVVKKRKPFEIGDSIAVALPKDHILARKKDQVLLIANSIILITEDKANKKRLKEELKHMMEDIDKILE